MKIAKVTFGLLSNNKKSGRFYIFNTDLRLEHGDVVVVDSKGKEVNAIFVGYYNGTKEAKKNIIRKATETEVIQYWNDVESKLCNNPLRVEDKAFTSYRYNFRDNKNASIVETMCKLTRNVLLSSNLKSFQYINNKMIFNYGTMEIVVKGDTVTDVYVNKSYQEFNIDKDKKAKIEMELSKHLLHKKFSQNDDKYKITPPTKDELTSKGFTNKIKMSPIATKESLLKYGFTNAVPDTLYYCTMVGHNISFNMSVDVETSEIKSIDVLDESFLQPYDYQSMLMNNNSFVPARQVFDRVDKVLSNMQCANIITGYERGMYV